MKLGFLTACLPQRSLTDIAAWAAANAFEALEVAGKAVVREDPWDVGWWRYRVPGLGQVDWGAVVDTLYEGGFDGVLSVEHEDPVWGGTEDRIETGLRSPTAPYDRFSSPDTG